MPDTGHCAGYRSLRPAHIVKLAPDDVYLRGDGPQVIVRLLVADIARADDLADLPGHLHEHEQEYQRGSDSTPTRDFTRGFATRTPLAMGQGETDEVEVWRCLQVVSVSGTH